MSGSGRKLGAEAGGSCPRGAAVNRAQRRHAAHDRLPARGHGVVGQPEQVCEAGAPGTEAMETAVALDIAWFKAYPGETEFLRPAIPGEFLPFHDDQTVWGAVTPPNMPEGYRAARFVRVYQLAPGERTRMPILVAVPSGMAGEKDRNTGKPMN